MKFAISGLIGIIFTGLILLFSPQAYAQELNLSLHSGKVGSNNNVESWSKDTVVVAGDKVKFNVQVRNNTLGTTSQDVKVQVTLPTNFSTAQVKATITSSNAPTTSDTTTINITGSTGSLAFIEGSTFLSGNDGTTTWNNVVFGDDIVKAGFSLPNGLVGGESNIITIQFQADVVHLAVSPSDSTQNNSSQSPSSSSPATCSASKPATPTLNSALRSSAVTAQLAWTEVAMATKYVIFYGTSSGNYEYAADVGKTTSYTVGGLIPGKSFYFVVQAVNTCVPSDNSNQKVAYAIGVLAGSVQDSSEQGEVLAEETAGDLQEPEDVQDTASQAAVQSLQKASFPYVPVFMAVFFVSLAFGLYLFFARK